jgi:hypothetical protein
VEPHHTDPSQRIPSATAMTHEEDNDVDALIRQTSLQVARESASGSTRPSSISDDSGQLHKKRKRMIMIEISDSEDEQPDTESESDSDDY